MTLRRLVDAKGIVERSSLNAQHAFLRNVFICDGFIATKLQLTALISDALRKTSNKLYVYSGILIEICAAVKVSNALICVFIHSSLDATVVWQSHG